MSEVTYKKIVDVEQIDTLGEGTTLFVNDGGSMKQMGAAALGAVKSVNGVLPDENGDIEVNAAEKIVFAYMPEMGDLLCEKTATEIHELYNNVTTAHGLCFVLRVYDFTNPKAPIPDYLYNKIEVESIQNGGTYYKLVYHIHFGDAVAPVLVDAINNTITLDPDWVKPEENVQLDWNQNDPNAPDYVKNRTHWEEVTEAVTEVPDTTFTSTIDAGQGVAMLSVAPNVTAIGDKREIIYDGVSYVCEAAEFQYTPGVLYLGNASIMGAGDDSGEPFFWIINSKTNTTFVNTDTVATAHTVSCKTMRVETVHPLDPKYLPEDHINKMIDSNEKITALTEEIAKQGETLPKYVISEADSVIDKIAAVQGNRTFTLAAITDLHYGNGSYTDGVKHATQALKYIDERIKLDAVAVLGDFTDGFTGREGQYANAIADFRAVNAVLNGLRFGPNLRIHGNHDFYEGHMPEILRYTNAYSDDVLWGSSAGDYFYRDFSNHKLRIVCLNTVANDGGSVGYTDEQAQWFADMLDLSDKDDTASWHILILSHQPVDYGHASGYKRHMASIIDAYVKGTSYTNGGVTCDFAGKNAATLVGNIHGHIHNLLVDRIYVDLTSPGVQTDALRIATPEACYGRPNGYNGVWHEEVSYPKTKNTADDTSFIVYCIDLDTNTIKAICYGAGYDRTITYGDTLSWEADVEDEGGAGDEGDGGYDDFTGTNWIPLAIDTDGNVVTDGAMYMDSRWNSSDQVVDAEGYFITGLIPAKIGDMVRVRWDNTTGSNTSSYCAIRAFDVNRNALQGRVQLSSSLIEGTEVGNAFMNSAGFQMSIVNGVFDFTLPTTYYTPDETVYIAFTLSGNPDKAIVTINEPIE